MVNYIANFKSSDISDIVNPCHKCVKYTKLYFYNVQVNSLWPNKGLQFLAVYMDFVSPE